MMNEQGLDEIVVKQLKLDLPPANLNEWQAIVEAKQNPQAEVNIAMVGKYVDLTESYKSLNEALYHAGYANRSRVKIEYFDSEKLDDASVLANCDGILVPHGFGSRGADGKIAAAGYARAERIPFLGICFGMHFAVIDYARNVAGLAGANSSEVDPDTPYPVIDLLPEQREIEDKGATMRLGAWPCVLTPGTHTFRAYGQERISERHRHRYEFNPEFQERLTAAGLIIAGTSPDGRLVEVIELPEHPWFVACQFHPEFASTPFRPHPLVSAFIAATKRSAKHD